MGKSTMIREISKHYSVISTASTGISAVNINGATIDSTLRLNDSQKDFKENMKSIKTQLDKVDNEEDDEEKIRELHLMKSDILVIDEISMIDGVKFDEIIERINIINELREKNLILIICGDVLQLPPINSISGYFFYAHNFDEFSKNSYKCKLDEVKRQNNQDFIKMLQRIRIGTYEKDDITTIKRMKNNIVDENEAVHLCAKNVDVDSINKHF